MSACTKPERLHMRLLIQPRDGVEPLLKAIKGARKSIDILIFRLDWRELETALKAASKRGIAVRALIAHTNRGGESKLRSLEMRFLEAGITVARTADDLVRYHGKMMIVDRQSLYLLSFNFLHIDIEHSRGFGIDTRHVKFVHEALKLFEADTNRQTYTPSVNTFIVSPANARAQLTAFVEKAKKQLLIYDPKIADHQIVGILQKQAKAGVDVRVIGCVVPRNANLPVAPLTCMRLHTRTIIRDGRDAFIGSQSLRPPELDSRREIGIIVRDPRLVNELLGTFEKDWDSTGFEELHAAGAEEPAPSPPAEAEQALATAIKQAVRKAVARAGPEVLDNGNLTTAVKHTVRKAVKEAVKEFAASAEEA
jgi:phosphatidylserine/phosphatidylglycerophosphate/cardiolipin synthase-like enzyme